LCWFVRGSDKQAESVIVFDGRRHLLERRRFQHLASEHGQFPLEQVFRSRIECARALRNGLAETGAAEKRAGTLAERFDQYKAEIQDIVTRGIEHPKYELKRESLSPI
jgi:hypothetical protein